jgi:23S rRNA pseudouridine1911/1915/1917 synthase
LSLADGEHQVPAALAGRLDRALRELAGGSWNEVRRAIETGKVAVDEATVIDSGAIVAAGARIRVRMAAPRPRATAAADLVVFADAHVVVVRKPAGVSTVPYDENERDTLVDRVRDALALRDGRRAPPGIVHRLDKETSGLVMFARNVAAKRHLKQQLRVHSVTRRYLAIAAGTVTAQTMRSRLVKDRGDGKRGSTKNPKLGREAVTRVRPLEPFAAATLIECTLETGRTHQVRIHLAEAGHPLYGERIYLRHDMRPSPAPRLMLHAAVLGFVHPATEQPLLFEEPLPADMQRVLERLRQGPT